MNLAVIGDGPLGPELKKLAAELKIEDRIHFLGFRNDISDILADLDIFILPSSHEGLGASILEASGAGIPVIASNFPLWSRMINKFQCGITVDPTNPKKITAKHHHSHTDFSPSHTVGKLQKI